MSFSMCRSVLITTLVSMSSNCSSILITYSFLPKSHCPTSKSSHSPRFVNFSIWTHPFYPVTSSKSHFISPAIMHTFLLSRSITESPGAIIDTVIFYVDMPWIVAIRNKVIATFLCSLFMECCRLLEVSLLSGLFVSTALIIVSLISGLFIFINEIVLMCYE